MSSIWRSPTARSHEPCGERHARRTRAAWDARVRQRVDGGLPVTAPRAGLVAIPGDRNPRGLAAKWGRRPGADVKEPAIVDTEAMT